MSIYSLTLPPKETPTTGVYSGNDIDWSILFDPGIDPDYGVYCPHCGSELDDNFQEQCQDCGEAIDWTSLDYQTDTLLYGTWIQDADGCYSPDKEGEYSAIYNCNYNTVQVVWSTRVLYGRPASPCYPYQVDARIEDTESPDTDRQYPYYAMPEWTLYEK